MFIKTERLLIRRFEFKDWQAVHEYTSDINVMKFNFSKVIVYIQTM